MNKRLDQTGILENSIETVRFATGARLEALHKGQIYTIRDLLAYYPFRYNDFTDVTSIANARIGQTVGVLGTIDQVTAKQTRRGFRLIEIVVVDGSGILKAVWFNQPWLEKSFIKGHKVLLLGKLEHSYGYKNMANPLYSMVGSVSNTEKGTETVDEKGIQPVYHAIGELSSNWTKRLVIEALAVAGEPLDPIPAKLRIKRQLTSRQIAIKQIHFPDSQQQLELAHQRLAYEEILMLQLQMALAGRKQTQKSNYTHQIKGPLFQKFQKNLTFNLTPSQISAVQEILENMAAPERMNRMLLGDVGSGKTIVANHALIAAAQSGWQAAMMAPTEVLALQYANAIGTLLNKINVKWTLITSNTPVADRQKALEDLKNGEVSIAFGTHALIEPDVQFRELSLVVIDEQQRFGVKQRKKLLDKNPGSDFLSMTATPIPRSLALVVYGDITTSYLDSRPMPAQITTTLLDGSRINEAYEQVRSALGKGQQAYIVCPLISAPNQKTATTNQNSKIHSSEIDGSEFAQLIDNLFDFLDDDHIKAAEQEVRYLQDKVFPDAKVALLTSKLPNVQKQQVMDDFRSGQIDILVSTTVIEVGVDVPNATVMIVQDADRFGLAQLHQLRGRVGRGENDSQVFLITRTRRGPALERLKLLEKINDGLKLAEHDLLMRREGDIAGVRQSGETALTLINVIKDAELINQAHQDCQDLLSEDPTLQSQEHLHLKYELHALKNHRMAQAKYLQKKD